MKVMENDRGIALERLMRSHQAGVWRYLRVLGCDPARADELTQDTFIAAMQGPFEERSEKETAAWLRTIARNGLLKSLRDEHRRRAMSIAKGAEAFLETGSSDGTQVWVDALRACLEELDDRLRMAVDLRYREQKPPAEIGVALGMSEGGAMNLLTRAKARLKACVSQKVKA